jgi:hypothetical protein
VTLELAKDRRHGERRERGRAGRLEAVDRLQQAERGDLDEVVERLAAALVAARELARERQEALDERLASRGIAVAVVALQQALVLARPNRALALGAGISSATTVTRRMIDGLQTLSPFSLRWAPGSGALEVCSGLLGCSPTSVVGVR